MAASQCGVDRVGLILRKPQRQSDNVLLNTSIATAMSLGFERFVVSSENGLVRKQDSTSKRNQAEIADNSDSSSLAALQRYADRSPPSPTEILRIAFHSMDESPTSGDQGSSLQPYLRQLEDLAEKYNDVEEIIARSLSAAETDRSFKDRSLKHFTG
jgi:hypothetical protein